MKNPWVVILVIMVVLIGGSVWYSSTVTARNNEGITTGTTHRMGAEGATVTLVEFSDFQCPACAEFHPVVKDVLEQYGDAIAFEYRHFPLSSIHPYAEQAARAAEAAGQQGKFFEYHDLLFTRQATWGKHRTPTVLFSEYAKELGLDVEQFERQMRSTLLRDEVRADAAEGRERQLTGTPTFFLNGERMNVTTYQEFFDQIGRAVDPSYGLSTSTATSTQAAPPVRFGI